MDEELRQRITARLHFVQSGQVERRLGRALSRAREDRENGDYAEVSFFDAGDARRNIADARELIDTARRITGAAPDQ